MKKAAIAIDEWKLPIFERHLKQSGYSFESNGLLLPDILLLQVETTNLEALGEIIKAANTESAQTGAPA